MKRRGLCWNLGQIFKRILIFSLSFLFGFESVFAYPVPAGIGFGQVSNLSLAVNPNNPFTVGFSNDLPLWQRERAVGELLYLALLSDSDLWVNLSEGGISQMGSPSLLASSLSRDLLEADLELKRRAQRYLVYYGDFFFSPEELRFRFWIEPKRARVVCDGNLCGVRELSFRVRWEGKGIDKELSWVFDKVAKVLEREVNRDPEFSRLREISREVVLSRLVRDRMKGGQNRIYQVLLNSTLQEYVFDWFSRPGILEEYRQIFLEADDVVVGGWDFSSVREIIDVVNGDLTGIKGYRLDIEDTVSTFSALSEKWFRDDITRDRNKDKAIEGLIEAYLLRLWIAGAVSSGDFDHSLSRLISLSARGYALLFNGNSEAEGRFLRVAEQYKRNLVREGNEFRIELEDKRIRLWQEGGQWQIEVAPKGGVIEKVGRGSSFIGLDGKVRLAKAEDLVHYIEGHIKVMNFKKERPGRWEEVLERFVGSPLRYEFLRLFVSIRYGEKDRGVVEALQAHSEEGERFVSENGQVLWHRLVDEALTMYVELKGREEKDEEEGRFVEVVSDILGGFEKEIFGRKRKDGFDASGVGRFNCIPEAVRRSLQRIDELLRLAGAEQITQLQKIWNEIDVTLSDEQVGATIEEYKRLYPSFANVLDGLINDLIEDKRIVWDIKVDWEKTLDEYYQSARAAEFREDSEAILSIEDNLRKDLAKIQAEMQMIRDAVLTKIYLVRELVKKGNFADVIKKRMEMIKEKEEALSKKGVSTIEVANVESDLERVLMGMPLVMQVKLAIADAIEKALERKISTEEEFFDEIGKFLKEALRKQAKIFVGITEAEIDEVVKGLSKQDFARRLARMSLGFGRLGEQINKKRAMQKAISEEQRERIVVGAKEEKKGRISEEKRQLIKKALFTLIMVLSYKLSYLFGVDSHLSLISVLPVIGLLTRSPPRAPAGQVELAKEVLESDVKDSRLIPSSRIERVIQSINVELAKESGPSLVLLSALPGQGKSAILREWMRRVLSGEITSMSGYKIYKINPSAISSTDTASAVEALVAVNKRNEGRVVFVMDEVHQAVDLLEALKENLEGSGLERLRILCATTPEEWTRAVERNPALDSRAQKIILPRMEESELLMLLRIKADEYREKYGIEITDSALKTMVEKLPLVYSEYEEPRRSLDFLEAMVQEKLVRGKNVIDELRNHLQVYANSLYQYITSSEALRQVFAKEVEANKKALRAVVEKVGAVFGRSAENRITQDDVFTRLRQRGIPELLLRNDVKAKEEWLEGLRDYLKQQVKGRDKEIDKIVEILGKNLTNSNHKGPLGIFFLAGPPGVGKTEIARAIARYISGGKGFVRVDGTSLLALSQFTSAPPSYVGHGKTKSIVEAINEARRESPAPVICVDEVEKAGFDTHLNSEQVARFISYLVLPSEEGEITDANGKKASLHNAILIFTSNIGTEEVQEGMSNEDMSKHYLARVKDLFSSAPGVLSRIEKEGAILPVLPLTGRDVKEMVLDRYLPEVMEFYQKRGIDLEITNSEEIADVVANYYEKNHDLQTGIRPALALVKMIEGEVERRLSEAGIKEGETVKVEVILGVEGEEIEVDVEIVERGEKGVEIDLPEELISIARERGREGIVEALLEQVYRRLSGQNGEVVEWKEVAISELKRYVSEDVVENIIEPIFKANEIDRRAFLEGKSEFLPRVIGSEVESDEVESVLSQSGPIERVRMREEGEDVSVLLPLPSPRWIGVFGNQLKAVAESEAIKGQPDALSMALLMLRDLISGNNASVRLVGDGIEISFKRTVPVEVEDEEPEVEERKQESEVIGEQISQSEKEGQDSGVGEEQIVQSREEEEVVAEGSSEGEVITEDQSEQKEDSADNSEESETEEDGQDQSVEVISEENQKADSESQEEIKEDESQGVQREEKTNTEVRSAQAEEPSEEPTQISLEDTFKYLAEVSYVRNKNDDWYNSVERLIRYGVWAYGDGFLKGIWKEQADGRNPGRAVLYWIAQQLDKQETIANEDLVVRLLRSLLEDPKLPTTGFQRAIDLILLDKVREGIRKRMQDKADEIFWKGILEEITTRFFAGEKKWSLALHRLRIVGGGATILAFVPSLILIGIILPAQLVEMDGSRFLYYVMALAVSFFLFSLRFGAHNEWGILYSSLLVFHVFAFNLSARLMDVYDSF